MNEVNGIVLNIVANVFFNLSFGYFYSYFLYCQHPIRSILSFTFFFNVIFAPISLILSDNYALREIVMFALVLSYLKIFYPGNSNGRILYAFFIHLIVAAFTELFLCILAYLITGTMFSFSTRFSVSFSLYVIEAIMFFIEYTLCIRFLARKAFEANRYSLCQICLLISQSMLLFYAINNIFDIRHHSITVYNFLIFLILVAIYTILLITLIYLNKKRKKNESIELLQKEYKKQIKEYLKLADNENRYRMLRHDLMNYILSLQYDLNITEREQE